MILWIISIGLIIIGALVYMILRTGNKGTKILVERFEERNGSLVSMDAKKAIIAKQFRNKSGIEVLRLPRKYSKEDIEGVSPKHTNLTSNGMAKARLLMVAEEVYIPLLASKVTNKQIYTDLIDNRDAVAFYLDERVRNSERYKDKLSFMEKYGGIIGVAFVGVILLISIIFITRFATEQMADAREESVSTTNKILDTLKGFTGQNQVSTAVETTVDRPLGNTVPEGG